jgi:hypothetical protein
MGGAGAVAITYDGLTTSNSHIISNLTIQNSTGGDPTQGAGAFALQSIGKTLGLNVTVQDSLFAFNQALPNRPESSPLTGVAGAVRIYAKSTDLETSNRVQIINTRFYSNSLDESCTGVLCMAGALALSVPAVVSRCTFDANTCPRGSGGLYSERAVELRGSQLINNTAAQVFFGTANVGEFSAFNTSLHFSGSQGGMVFNNLSSYDGLQLTCPPGAEISSDNRQHHDNSTQNQYTCKECPSGQYSFASGRWLDGVRSPVCMACPELDPSVVNCEGKTVASRPGYFSHYISTGSRRTDTYTVVAVTECPNRHACKLVGLIDTVCETSLPVCNSNISSGKCDAGYTGLLCAQCDSGWFSGKLSALECKTCANASLLVSVAIASTLGVYAIGVVLGQKTVSHIDTQVEDPTLEHEKHLKALKRQLKRGRELNIVSSSFKMLMVHGSVVSAVIGVDWAWKSTVQGLMGATTAPSGSIMEFDFGCALSFDFQTKMYVFVIHPMVAMAFLHLMAAILSKSTVVFENLRGTAWLLTTVFIYTFGASIISDLFMVFPCFEGAGGLKMMLHDPSTSCYGYSTLMLLVPIAICVYTAAAMYVLGFAFWSRKAIIQKPADYDQLELEDTFKAFGFLFYDYEPKYFYWEMLVFTRKLLVLVISIWFPPATSMTTRTFGLAILVCSSLVLTARFRPYLQSQADTLDIVTQLVSMMSILVAQYVHTSKMTYGDEGREARAVGTVMFAVSNTVLLVVHAFLVAVPLWEKISASYASVQERFAAGAEESTNGAVVELESSEDVTITNDEIPEEILWSRDTTATLDIHANPLASKQDQCSTIISGLKPPLDPTEGALKQGADPAEEAYNKSWLRRMRESPRDNREESLRSSPRSPRSQHTTSTDNLL